MGHLGPNYNVIESWHCPVEGGGGGLITENDG